MPSFPIHDLDDIPTPGWDVLDATQPLRVARMSWMEDGEDSRGKYRQYRSPTIDPERSLVVRMYTHNGERITHVIGEIVVTDHNKQGFVPYFRRIQVPISMEVTPLPEG